jgi:hypothetical protein
MIFCLVLLLLCPCCCCSALPVTARSLEALIRLSQAHAKLHLADRVEAIDVQAASRWVLGTGRREECAALVRIA